MESLIWSVRNHHSVSIHTFVATLKESGIAGPPIPTTTSITCLVTLITITRLGVGLWIALALVAITVVRLRASSLILTALRAACCLFVATATAATFGWRRHDSILVFDGDVQNGHVAGQELSQVGYSASRVTVKWVAHRFLVRVFTSS